MVLARSSTALSTVHSLAERPSRRRRFALSAHQPSTPPLQATPTQARAPTHAEGQPDWAALLAELDRSARQSDPASQLPITWALHAWANEHLDSAAIRSGGTEGLIGPAPARWRVLCHEADSSSGEPGSGSGFAVAILDGRAPLRSANVLASLLVAPGRSAIISVRGPTAPSEPAQFDTSVRQRIADSSAALLALVDLALGRCARVSGSATALPSALRLAAGLALRQRGAELALSAQPARKTRRPRAFVATRDPAAIRRQLSAVEAALRKRDRCKNL